MYILNAYRVEEKAELLAFMHQNSFATLVSIVDGSPFASHLPLTVVDNGEQILLRGHFAKANPHWRAHENGGELLTIFHGAHAYISPSQYETQEAVPTWNYIAVHVYGTMRLLAAGAETIATLEQLFDSFDAGYRNQWQNLTPKFREGMLKGIVAFEITVTRLEGKAKLSQNRSVTDQTNVANWLLNHEDASAKEVGRLMLEKVNAQPGLGD